MLGDALEVAVDEPEIGHDVSLVPVSSFKTLGKLLVEFAV
jgi:hypothetical protein